MYLVTQHDCRFVSRNFHATHIALTERLRSNAFLKSSSVINLFYSYKETQTWFECSVLFSWSYQRGLLFPISLSLQVLPISTLSRRTANKTSWSNPRQTRICYIFRVWVVIKALLKQISLYLLSLLRIRIIVLLNIMLYYKSARNHQPKSCVAAKSHKSQWCEAGPILFPLKSSLPFSLFLFAWWLERTTTKS